MRALERESGPPGRRQRGVALILALLLMTLATIVAVAVASTEEFALRRSTNALRRVQASEYLAAGELQVKAGRSLLRYTDGMVLDAKGDTKRAEKVMKAVEEGKKAGVAAAAATTS